MFLTPETLMGETNNERRAVKKAGIEHSRKTEDNMLVFPERSRKTF